MSPRRERVARNFIRTRGIQRLRWMISMFKLGRGGQEIASELGVSRERVRQWKHIFGETITWYTVYPEVNAQLGPQ